MKSRLSPRAIHVALFHENDLKILSLPQMISLRASESSMVKIAGQRLDLDPHRAARLFEQIFVGMREQHNRLFRMIHEFRRRGRVDLR